jgi:hypothetical protein
MHPVADTKPIVLISNDDVSIFLLSIILNMKLKVLAFMPIQHEESSNLPQTWHAYARKIF